MGKNFRGFEKVFLPIDERELSKKTMAFIGNFLSKFDEVSKITLFHVISPGHLILYSKRMDLRIDSLKETELFKKLKEKFVNEKIKPFLEEYQKILKEKGIKKEIEQKIEEGEPGNKIIEALLKGDYSSVFLSRRGISLKESFILGSVSTKIIYNVKKQSIYLVGKKFLENPERPISTLLVLVDGSEYSKKGVEHAVYIAKNLKLEKIVILRVINLDLYYERINQGIDPEKEAEETLSLAKRKFLDAFISDKLVQTYIRVGIPAKEIVKEIEENNYDLVIMGRRGRSPLKDLIMGGVSSAVIYKCMAPIIVIINL